MKTYIEGLIMAYSGFIANPEYTRRTQDESITGSWTFEGEVTVKKVIRGLGLATYYGDLAEYYDYDISEVIPQGTIVKFGGSEEVTKTKPNDREYFGIVSTNPGIELNKTDDGESYKHLPIALCGKVPCRTRGKVKKFDKLTTSKIPGVAKRKTLIDTLLFKPTVGIALEDKFDKSEKLIAIFVKTSF